jgi:hypothetical protein
MAATERTFHTRCCALFTRVLYSYLENQPSKRNRQKYRLGFRGSAKQRDSAASLVGIIPQIVEAANEAENRHEDTGPHSCKRSRHEAMRRLSTLHIAKEDDDGAENT